jgi:hypothetical protein
MIKPTPNPPQTDPTSPYESLDSKKLHEAAERALDHYLRPSSGADQTPRKPSTMFMVAPDKKTEELLVNACESLASASVMLSDFAGLLGTPYRHTLLGIQQVVMLGELTVNRALDNFEPKD